MCELFMQVFSLQQNAFSLNITLFQRRGADVCVCVLVCLNAVK